MTKSKHLLKIGFVLDGGLEEPDGVQQYILSLGEYYKSLGHEVRYVVAGKAAYGGEDAVSLNSSIGVKSNGNKLTIPLPAGRHKMRRFMEREQFDVLHVQTPYSPLMGEQLIYLADPGVAIVGTYHIVPRSKILDVGNWVLGHWCRPSLKRFDKMVSVSEAAARTARRDFGMDTEILPNVINFKRFNQAPVFKEKDVLTIAFLGRLVERKGCIYLLKAARILFERDDVPAFRVVIGGKGPLEHSLKDFVRMSGMEDIVEFEGFVTEEEKPQFYASADISVFPSQGGESFGIVLIEAMASGQSVVLAGDNEGYSEIMSVQPDLIFPRDNYEVLADKLSQLLNQKKLRDKYTKWGKSYAAKFDSKVIGDKLLDIYNEALLKRRGSDIM